MLESVAPVVRLALVACAASLAPPALADTDSAVALDTCDSSAGCSAFAQAPAELPPGARARLAFDCPADHPFLHGWDARFSGDASLLLRSATTQGVRLSAVNRGAAAVTASVVLGCSTQGYEGRALLRKVEGIPAEAPGQDGGRP